MNYFQDTHQFKLTLLVLKFFCEGEYFHKWGSNSSSGCYQGGSSAKDHRNHNKYVFRSSSISTEKISRCRVNFLIMPRSPTKFPSLLKCTQVWHQVLKSQGNSSWNPPNLYLGHSCLIFLNALLLAERTLKKHSMSKLDVPTQTVIL